MRAEGLVDVAETTDGVVLHDLTDIQFDEHIAVRAGR
jgi:hypothetical protein